MLSLSDLRENVYYIPEPLGLRHVVQGCRGEAEQKGDVENAPRN